MSEATSLTNRFLSSALAPYANKQATLEAWVIDSPRWFRFGKAAQLDTAKTAFLRDWLATLRGRCYLSSIDSPIDCEVAGDWRQSANDYWKIPADVDFDALGKLLAVGGWTILVAGSGYDEATPVDFNIDDLGATLRALQKHHIEAMICAYYDDTTWWLAFA